MSREIDLIKKAAGDYRRWALEARREYINLRMRQDPQIRALYIRAADSVAKRLRRVGVDTPSGLIRRSHLEEMEKALRMEADKLTEGYRRRMEGYIEGAVGAGAGYSRLITSDLLRKAGISTEGVPRLFAGVNTQAVEACWARTKKGLHLSDRIWRQGEKLRENVRNIIQDAVASGQDAVTTARMLEKYVRKDKRTIAAQYPEMMKRMGGRIPGDVCYEALRLARTEMSAAFGEGTVAAAQVAPSYIGIQWVLSNSHPEFDICDHFAAHDEGLGKGVYGPEAELPPFPAHPNCICHLVPVHEEPGRFVERLKRWKDNPANEPKLERWYQDVYRPSRSSGPKVQKPAFLRVTEHDPRYDDAADRRQIKSDLGLIPARHRKILQAAGVVVQTGYMVSRYDRKSRVIQVGRGAVPGEVVHELGHAIETELGLYGDKRFRALLDDLVKGKGYEDVIRDVDSFSKPIYRLRSGRLISDYQGRIYPGDAGIIDAAGNVNSVLLAEYFSEGYREYIQRPDVLLKKDPALYRFIEEVLGR